MVTTLTARVLGQRIRQLRTRRGLTQQDLAGDDYSKSYISAIEQGKTRPSLEALQRIAARLEVPAGILLDPDAPGFAPFDPEALPRRVRRRRGLRAGAAGQGFFDPAQLDLQLAEAELLIYKGQPGQAIDLLRPLLPEEGSTTPPQRHLEATQQQQAYYLSAMAAVRQGASAEALEYLQKGIAIATRLGDREALERLRNLLGVTYYQADQPLSALEHHRTCLEAIQAELVRDPNFKLLVYSNIAADYWALHDNERAIATYKSALDLLDTVNSVDRQARIFWGLSGGYADMGNYQAARMNATKALSIYEALDNMQLVTRMENRYGNILVETGDADAAEGLLSHSLTLAESLNSDVDRAVALTSLARVSMGRGDLEDADRRAVEAIRIGREAVRVAGQDGGNNGNEEAMHRGKQKRAQARHGLAETLALAGEVATRQGQTDKADRAFGEAIEIIESDEAPDIASEIYQRYAQVLAARGQHEQASKYFEQAYKAVTRRSR